MVNCLLTISIKVNIPSSAESQWTNGVTTMKKVKTGRGFWELAHGRRLGLPAATAKPELCPTFGRQIKELKALAPAGAFVL